MAKITGRYSISDVGQTQYYQMPKFLFSGICKGLSNDARVLYSILRSRHQLSIQNCWVNSKGEVYIIFTREDMAEEIGISSLTTIRKIVTELKSVGLLSEERQGCNKPNLLYLCKPILNNPDCTTEQTKNDCLDNQKMTPNKKDINNIRVRGIKPSNVTVLENKEILEFIEWYCNCLYVDYYGYKHPEIEKYQYQGITEKLLVFVSLHNVNLDVLKDIAISFLEACKSNDHNIYHFVSGNMLEVRYYDTTKR